jgi:hypothetical protein
VVEGAERCQTDARRDRFIAGQPAFSDDKPCFGGPVPLGGGILRAKRYSYNLWCVGFSAFFGARLLPEGISGISYDRDAGSCFFMALSTGKTWSIRIATRLLADLIGRESR